MNLIENHWTFSEPSKKRGVTVFGQKSSIWKHGHLGTFCQELFKINFAKLYIKWMSFKNYNYNLNKNIY